MPQRTLGFGCLCPGTKHTGAARSSQPSRVVGIDIKPAYIGACGARFEGGIPGLGYYIGDIQRGDFAFGPVALVYTGPVFEHFDVGAALKRPKLVLGGTLATVLRPEPDRGSGHAIIFRSCIDTFSCDASRITRRPTGLRRTTRLSADRVAAD